VLIPHRNFTKLEKLIEKRQGAYFQVEAVAVGEVQEAINKVQQTAA